MSKRPMQADFASGLKRPTMFPDAVGLLNLSVSCEIVSIYLSMRSFSSGSTSDKA